MHTGAGPGTGNRDRGSCTRPPASVCGLLLYPVQHWYLSAHASVAYACSKPHIYQKLVIRMLARAAFARIGRASGAWAPLSLARATATGTGTGTGTATASTKPKHKASRPQKTATDPNAEAPSASAVASKAASRVLQAATTPDAEAAGGLLQEEAVKAGAGWVKGKVVGPIKSAIYKRMLFGSALALPAVGLLFALKSAHGNGKKVLEVRRDAAEARTAQSRATGLAMAAFTTAAAADIVNAVTRISAIAEAAQKQAATDPWLHQLAAAVQEAALVSPELSATCAAISTACVIAGDVYSQHQSAKELVDKVPAAKEAALHATAAAAAVVKREEDAAVAAKTARALAAADEAVEQGLPPQKDKSKVGGVVWEKPLPARVASKLQQGVQGAAQSLEEGQTPKKRKPRKPKTPAKTEAAGESDGWPYQS